MCGDIDDLLIALEEDEEARGVVFRLPRRSKGG
jgi:hypothetical protein